VLGTLLPTDSDKRCRNGVAGSPRQIEVYSRTSGGWGRSRSLFEGEPRKSVDFCRLRFRAPAAPISSHRQGFWRKQRKKSPIAWPCAVGAAPFGWEQSVPGTPFRRTATTIQECVAVSRQQTEVYAPDPENYGAGPSHARRRLSKIGRLSSPHSLAQKATRSDHHRQRTALEIESGRSALVAGTGLHAPLPSLRATRRERVPRAALKHSVGRLR
jgi:hypothetical protein